MTREIYVTATETTYCEGEVYVDLYGRTEDRELEWIRVEGFEPYFFVRREVAEDLNPTAHEDIASVEPDCGEESLMGDPLGKVVASHPGAVSDLRERWDQTWEADVLFTNRFRIDAEVETGVRAPSGLVTADELEPIEMSVEERRLTFDIEVDDSNGFPQRRQARALQGHS
jgi:DNA polymerase elongation subunit (family B)